MITANERLRTAFHEAGHAIARHHFGGSVVKIEIFDELTEHPRYGDATGLTTVSKPPRTRFELAVCCLSGPAAEAGLLGTTLAAMLDGPGATDLQHAMYHLRYACRADVPVLINSPLDVVSRMAVGLMQHYWPTIERVAAALIERGMLEGEEVLRIING